jgi:hypothetical protein
MAKRFLVFLLFLALFLIPLVSSAPPITQVQQFTTGYIIKVPVQETIKQGQDFTFYFHVFNISDGIPITNLTTKCFFHLYNSSGKHIVNITADYEKLPNVFNEWESYIKGGNFSNVGLYNYIIQCNSSILGGYFEMPLEVTGTGLELTTSRSIIYFGFFMLLIFFFTIILFSISKLPDSEERNNEGEIISINSLKYLKSVFLFIEWLLIISIFYLSSNLAFAYLGEQMFANILFTLFQISLGLTLPIVVIWFVWIFVNIFQDKKIKGLISHGIYPNKY